MPDYTINFTDITKGSFILKPSTSDGPIFPIANKLSGSAVSANSSLILYGKGHANYGERTDENLIHLLENFSGGTEPTFPNTGQLWYSRTLFWFDSVNVLWYKWNDATPSIPAAWSSPGQIIPSGSTFPLTPSNGNLFYLIPAGSPALAPTLNQYSSDERGIDNWIPLDFLSRTAPPGPTDVPEEILRVYDGSAWRYVNTGVALPIAPLNPTSGALWFDTTINQLKVYDGIGFIQTGANVLNDLSDVDTTTSIPQLQDLFQYDGTNWVPVAKPILSVGTTALDFPFTLATKSYVDLIASGTIASDTFITSGSIVQSTGILTLTYNNPIGSPALASFTITGFITNANELTFNGSGAIPSGNVDTALAFLDLNKVSISGDTMAGILDMGSNAIINIPLTPTNPTDAASKNYVDTLLGTTVVQEQNGRDIFSLTAPQSVFATSNTFLTGFNKLLVTVNGVKQYENTVGGSQSVIFGIGLSSSTSLGLTTFPVISVSPTFFEINNDVSFNFTVGDTIVVRDILATEQTHTITGILTVGSPVTSTQIQVAATGSFAAVSLGKIYDATVDVDTAGPQAVTINPFDTLTFGALTASLSSQISTPSATANIVGNTIFISSDIGPTGSILIVDGTTSTTALFANLFSFINIAPPTITTSFDYAENGVLGFVSSTITFNTPIPSGSIVEIINYL